MTEKNADLELMKNAYGLLYEIENSLRSYIHRKMEDYYGIHWYEVAPRKEYNRPPSRTFDSLNFSDYSSYFAIYPKAFKKIPRKFLTLLHQLYPIRNKIAHNHLLTHKEFGLLEENVAFLVNFMQSNL
ncbi:Swt1 family HEPN domain-containing protein [Virgibacillus sp. SK37]|uniref:Swt1 family HEPN domain-containing protein n=1 Tax=Virgibacillus sp. SK37 TaxID=403957 RepID=UPI001E4C9D71|nr:Swt1 family HEPN domain-containing protein [Virgibacillus sp. SK37]